MAPDRIHLSVAEAREHAERALRGTLIIQALGVLAGSGMDADQDDSYLLVDFKPDLLTPLDEFKREVGGLVDRIKSVSRQSGVDEICIPGERSFRSRERLSDEGIEIDRLVYDALAALRA